MNIIEKIFHRHDFVLIDKRFVDEGEDWNGWSGNEPYFDPLYYRRYILTSKCECGKIKKKKKKEYV